MRCLYERLVHFKMFDVDNVICSIFVNCFVGESGNSTTYNFRFTSVSPNSTIIYLLYKSNVFYLKYWKKSNFIFNALLDGNIIFQ